ASIVAALVFAPVIGHSFVNWDDDRNVYENPYLAPASWAHTAHFWRAADFHLYMPVTQSVWAAIAAVSGRPRAAPGGAHLGPALFHAASLVLHAVNAALVVAILMQLGASAWAAAIGSLFFALHPAQVEPVAWVTGLKDVLSGFFALFAIWQYVAFARGAGASTRGAIPY